MYNIDMSSESHILNNFQSSIEDLEVDLQKMTELTINNLKASINGLIQRDSAACSSVIASDDEINELEKDIDQKGIRIIMLYQPVASDLRLVTSKMKVTPNLERIGDQSVGIAKRARKMNKNPECPESSLTQPLHDLALSQLENAYLAFKNRDVDLALEVKKKDKDLNLICKELAKKLTKKMESDASRIKDYLDLHYIARSLERIGDYSKNICEDAIFLESAVDIRHGGELPESENS